MPKETIYAEHTPYGEESSAVSVVEVSWSREAEHVQLVTKCVDRSTLEPYAGPETENLREIPFTAGMYLSLRRSTINDLIRHLRRARDQAFGRDE
jgi:hypothetical protein